MTATETRTGYRPAVEYLADALRGQGNVIAKYVDSKLSNEKTLELAGAVERAVALAVRVRLAEVAADVLALQVEPECVADEPQGPDAFESHTVTFGVRSTTHHRSLCKPGVCGWEPMGRWLLMREFWADVLRTLRELVSPPRPVEDETAGDRR